MNSFCQFPNHFETHINFAMLKINPFTSKHCSAARFMLIFHTVQFHYSEQLDSEMQGLSVRHTLKNGRQSRYRSVSVEDFGFSPIWEAVCMGKKSYRKSVSQKALSGNKIDDIYQSDYFRLPKEEELRMLLLDWLFG